MADGLYLPDGTFQSFSKESFTMELATRHNAGLVLGNVGAWLSQLPDPDPILRARGDDSRVLDELLADDQVTTAVLSRKNRVLNCPHYAFRAGAADGESPSPEAQHVYSRLVQDLERTNMRSVISAMLDAPFYGFAPLELLWRRGVNGWWHLVNIIDRPQYWFDFDTHNNPRFCGEYGLACAEPTPLPAGKFHIVSHHATYNNPYGLRLLSRCLWPVAFKRGGLQFYSRFVERHGMPWVVGNAPPRATPQEKRAMAQDLSRMVQDCVAAIPFGSTVEFLTAGPTQGELHERFLARQDKAISKLLMGQTLTVEMEGANSLAASETHMSVAQDLADADKAMITDAWNEIAWLYTQANAGPNVLAPLFAYEEPEDLSRRAELDTKLCEMGVAFTAEHFTDNYGLKSTEFTLQTAKSPIGPSFAAPKESIPLVEQAQETLDSALATLLPVALKANAVFVTQVEKAIADATSFDDLQLALVELLAPRMQPSDLESFLARSMTMAAGFGATAVQAETHGNI